MSAAVFLLLAAAVVYEDVRARKIRHRVLLAGGAAAAALAAWHGTAGTAAAAGAAAGALGLALWLAGVWPAGDAKLYALLAALGVAMSPGREFLPLRYAVILLANSFLPAAAWIAGRALWEHRAGLARRLRSPSLSGEVPAAALLRELQSALFLTFLVSAAAPFLGKDAPLWLFAATLAVGPRLLEVAFDNPRPSWPKILVLAAGTAAITRSPRFLLWTGGFLVVQRLVISALLEKLERRGEVSVEALKPGLILAREVPRDAVYPDGLMPWQVPAVRRWARRRGLTRLPTLEADPFAAWLFMGTALTVWGRVNLASAVVGLLP